MKKILLTSCICFITLTMQDIVCGMSVSKLWHDKRAAKAENYPIPYYSYLTPDQMVPGEIVPNDPEFILVKRSCVDDPFFLSCNISVKKNDKKHSEIFLNKIIKWNAKVLAPEKKGLVFGSVSKNDEKPFILSLWVPFTGYELGGEEEVLFGFQNIAILKNRLEFWEKTLLTVRKAFRQTASLLTLAVNLEKQCSAATEKVLGVRREGETEFYLSADIVQKIPEAAAAVKIVSDIIPKIIKLFDDTVDLWKTWKCPRTEVGAILNFKKTGLPITIEKDDYAENANGEKVDYGEDQLLMTPCSFVPEEVLIAMNKKDYSFIELTAEPFDESEKKLWCGKSEPLGLAVPNELAENKDKLFYVLHNVFYFIEFERRAKEIVTRRCEMLSDYTCQVLRKIRSLFSCFGLDTIPIDSFVFMHKKSVTIEDFVFSALMMRQLEDGTESSKTDNELKSATNLHKQKAFLAAEDSEFTEKMSVSEELPKSLTEPEKQTEWEEIDSVIITVVDDQQDQKEEIVSKEEVKIETAESEKISGPSEVKEDQIKNRKRKKKKKAENMVPAESLSFEEKKDEIREDTGELKEENPEKSQDNPEEENEISEKLLLLQKESDEKLTPERKEFQNLE